MPIHWCDLHETECVEYQPTGSAAITYLRSRPGYKGRQCRKCNRGGFHLFRPTSQAIGTNFHRAGWPVALAALSRIQAGETELGNKRPGVLLDDFVEQTFAYGHIQAIHRQPWVGIFHHPPNMPEICRLSETPQAYTRQRAFIESLANLKAAIVLTEYQRPLFEQLLGVPVHVLTHPMPQDAKLWDHESYAANRRMVSVGAYCRNTWLPHQVPPSGIKRAILRPRSAWFAEWHRKCQANGESLGRPTYDGVESMARVDDDQYDELLASSVVIAEYFDAAATNTVLDCIVRNTPIAVNRHPAIVEYLGADYPLYFAEPSTLPSLLTEANVIAANEYLAAMDKSRLGIETWQKGVSTICHGVK